MTKEVAEKIVRGITDKIECNTVDIDDWAEFWGFTREEYEEFLDMAIKALEQQLIDKSAMMYEIYMEGVNMTGEYQGCWVRFKNIEKIVNKYMGESEEEG